MLQVKASKLHVRALSAQKWSSTSGVGESVVRFVEDSSLDLVVLGSRGMGSIKSSLLGALGMGSVSEFCLHNLKCPVLLVKDGCEVDAIGRKEPEEECANKEA